MYRMAYRDGDKVLYFDLAGNKHVASGGSLPWRINNPGLVRTRGLLIDLPSSALMKDLPSLAMSNMDEKLYLTG